MTQLVLKLNLPIRPLRSSRRALTGRVAMAEGNTANYESSLERDWLMALDFDWRIAQVVEQPFTLSYALDGKVRRYTPDVLAEFDDGKSRWTVVYEVKPHEALQDTWAHFRPRFKAAVHYCRARGWRFRIVTERDIRTPYVANVKFLRRYRGIAVQDLHKKALLYTLPALGTTTPQALLAATWGDYERRMTALPELWRLIGNRTIAASLFEPLTMATPIWLP